MLVGVISLAAVYVVLDRAISLGEATEIEEAATWLSAAASRLGSGLIGAIPPSHIIHYLCLRAPDGTPTLVLQTPEGEAADLSERFGATPLRRNGAVWMKDGRTLLFSTRTLPDGRLLQFAITSKLRNVVIRFFVDAVAVVVPLLGAIGLATGFMASRMSTAPVRQMIAELGSTTGVDPLSFPGQNPELSQLARLLNGIVEDLRASTQGVFHSLDLVVHELRTPLSRIRALTELAIESSNPSHHTRTSFSSALAEIDRALRMLRRLVDLTDYETGTVRLEQNRCNLTDIAADLVESYRYLAEERSIELTFTPEGLLPVLADADRMRIAMSNLVDNAIKYSREFDRIAVRAFRRGNLAVFEVTDTGPGIGPEDIPHVFDRLYRGKSSRSGTEGMGLGLALVRGIVRAHGGSCTAASTPEKATTFTISIPLHRDEDL
jgi:signal transduction histidine kinase